MHRRGGKKRNSEKSPVQPREHIIEPFLLIITPFYAFLFRRNSLHNFQIIPRPFKLLRDWPIHSFESTNDIYSSSLFVIFSSSVLAAITHTTKFAANKIHACLVTPSVSEEKFPQTILITEHVVFSFATNELTNPTSSHHLRQTEN